MDKCSFCSRNKKDVNLLIAGVSGHICDNCVEQAYEIVKEEIKQKILILTYQTLSFLSLLR
jgi:ATP-dependent Clp protease ATP-binding subunit ClpX